MRVTQHPKGSMVISQYIIIIVFISWCVPCCHSNPVDSDVIRKLRTERLVPWKRFGAARIPRNVPEQMDEQSDVALSPEVTGLGTGENEEPVLNGPDSGLVSSEHEMTGQSPDGVIHTGQLLDANYAPLLSGDVDGQSALEHHSGSGAGIDHPAPSGDGSTPQPGHIVNPGGNVGSGVQETGGNQHGADGLHSDHEPLYGDPDPDPDHILPDNPDAPDIDHLHPLPGEGSGTGIDTVDGSGAGSEHAGHESGIAPTSPAPHETDSGHLPQTGNHEPGAPDRVTSHQTSTGVLHGDHEGVDTGPHHAGQTGGGTEGTDNIDHLGGPGMSHTEGPIDRPIDKDGGSHQPNNPNTEGGTSSGEGGGEHISPMHEGEGGVLTNNSTERTTSLPPEIPEVTSSTSNSSGLTPKSVIEPTPAHGEENVSSSSSSAINILPGSEGQTLPGESQGYNQGGSASGEGSGSGSGDDKDDKDNEGKDTAADKRVSTLEPMTPMPSESSRMSRTGSFVEPSFTPVLGTVTPSIQVLATTKATISYLPEETNLSYMTSIVTRSTSPMFEYSTRSSETTVSGEIITAIPGRVHSQIHEVLTSPSASSSTPTLRLEPTIHPTATTEMSSAVVTERQTVTTMTSERLLPVEPSSVPDLTERKMITSSFDQTESLDFDLHNWSDEFNLFTDTVFPETDLFTDWFLYSTSSAEFVGSSDFVLPEERTDTHTSRTSTAKTNIPSTTQTTSTTSSSESTSPTSLLKFTTVSQDTSTAVTYPSSNGSSFPTNTSSNNTTIGFVTESSTLAYNSTPLRTGTSSRPATQSTHSATNTASTTATTTTTTTTTTHRAPTPSSNTSVSSSSRPSSPGHQTSTNVTMTTEKSTLINLFTTTLSTKTKDPNIGTNPLTTNTTSTLPTTTKHKPVVVTTKTTQKPDSNETGQTGSQWTTHPGNWTTLHPGHTPTATPGTPTIYIQIKLEMNWEDFCPRKDPFVIEIQQIIHQHGTVVKIEQIRIINLPEEECVISNILLNPGSRSLAQIEVEIYLTDDDGKLNMELTIDCSKVIEIGLKSGSSYFKDKVIEAKLVNRQTAIRNDESSNISPRKKMEPGVTIVIVIASVGGCCCVVLIILQVVMIHRRKAHKMRPYVSGQRLSVTSTDTVALGMIPKSRPDSGYWNPAQEDQESMPDQNENSHLVNFAGLANFSMDQHAIYEEFKSIPSENPSMSCVPIGAEDKNRYSNVIPFKHTRVRLKRVQGEDNSDYINANYVTGYHDDKGAYIATQAPLESTIGDFWRMVWEQQSRAILMLVPMEPDGQPHQCPVYWPDAVGMDSLRKYGELVITMKKKDVQQEYIESILEIKNIENNLVREIHHFWFTSWSLNGNAEPLSVVKFVLDTRPLYEDSGAPVILHCGPGTGRTGVLIAVDVCMRMFEDKRRVDIMRCVHRMKTERAGAVQTKEQYALIYMALNEYTVILSSPSISTRSSIVTLHAML